MSNELELQKFCVKNSGRPEKPQTKFWRACLQFQSFQTFPTFAKNTFHPHLHLHIWSLVALSELSKTCAQNPYHHCQYYQLWHCFLDPADIFVVSLILAISYLSGSPNHLLLDLTSVEEPGNTLQAVLTISLILAIWFSSCP